MSDVPKHNLSPEQDAFLDKLYEWVEANRGELDTKDLMGTLFTGSFAYLFGLPKDERAEELQRMAMFLRAMVKLNVEVSRDGHK